MKSPTAGMNTSMLPASTPGIANGRITLPNILRLVAYRSRDASKRRASIFSKLAAYDYEGWAVLEWECALKHPEDGAAEGAPFIASHIIRVTEKAFDDFAASGTDTAANRNILGIS